MQASHIPPSEATRKHTPCRESFFTERRPHTDTHAAGFHICLLSLPPSLNVYLLRSPPGHPRLQFVTTVTLCNVTSEWKEVCVCVCGCVCECLHNTEARDETPCKSDPMAALDVCESGGTSQMFNFVLIVCHFKTTARVFFIFFIQ